jgi:hypothetical protein
MKPKPLVVLKNFTTPVWVAMGLFLANAKGFRLGKTPKRREKL